MWLLYIYKSHFRVFKEVRILTFAEIIIDISTTALDRIFTYEIPKRLEDEVCVGSKVVIPFGQGNTLKTGYVINIKSEPEYDIKRIKAVKDVEQDAGLVESSLIKLAYWMKEHYGSTYIQALETVLPNNKMSPKRVTYLKLNVDLDIAKSLRADCELKHHNAKERLLGALIKNGTMSRPELGRTLKITGNTIESLIKEGIIKEEVVREYRNPGASFSAGEVRHELNDEQQHAFDIFREDYLSGYKGTYLLHGVTGSGKTEVYLEMIDEVINDGKSAIVLIPEIALTYQTVRRFKNRFGDDVTVIHSRLSEGERYDQLERIKNGDVRVVIGPRSALFAPFENLGLIVIDEEHEGAYKSEQAPRYHAREVAIKRASLCGASVVLGSATPSVESYTKALDGDYKLLTLKNRASDAVLPEVSVVDLKDELKAKNFSMFSRELKADIADRLNKKEQTMIFINRRGMAGFVSCIDCGYVVKCSHCDVSMKLHGDKLMMCHYCGSKIVKPDICPECKSKHIKAFGTGTERVVKELNKAFPDARVIRMDADTTRTKEGHEKILEQFAKGDADILVGTQMIVKGHDFPNVTLVCALAADLSLFEQDFRSNEKTFDLLTQAAGRAGRGVKPGKMIIQTRHPEEYAIMCSKTQDYISFYEQEISFRRMAKYPPDSHMLMVCMLSKKCDELESKSMVFKEFISKTAASDTESVRVIGPVEAYVYKVKDIYRRVIYVKHSDYELLVRIKNCVEDAIKAGALPTGVSTYFDFDPMTVF